MSKLVLHTLRIACRGFWLITSLFQQQKNVSTHCTTEDCDSDEDDAIEDVEDEEEDDDEDLDHDSQVTPTPTVSAK